MHYFLNIKRGVASILFFALLCTPILTVLGTFVSPEVAYAVETRGQSADARAQAEAAASGGQTGTPYEPGRLLTCGWTEFSCWIAMAAFWIMYAAAWLASVTSGILNWIVMELVANMGQMVGNMTGVVDAWEVLRDLANIFLVFLTIWIGITTIVGVSSFGGKQLIFRIIIAALLVNFSITFSKVIIDVSNLVAMQTYKMLVTGSDGPDSTKCYESPSTALTDLEDGNNVCINNSIAGVMWDKLKIMTLFSPKAFEDQASKASGEKPYIYLMLVGLMGTLLFLVLAFVTAAAAFLLLARFVILVFLIVISPIAFVMWITGVGGSGARWWHSLINQSMFAPAMFLCLWIAFKMADTVGTRFDLTSKSSLASSAVGASADFGIITYFVIVAAFMIASLLIAKQMGAYGASAAVSTGQRWSRRMAMAPINAGRAGGRWAGGHIANFAANRNREAMAEVMRTENGQFVHNGFMANANRLLINTGIHGAVQRGLDRGGQPVRARQAQRRADRADLANENRTQRLVNDAQVANANHGQTDAQIEAAAIARGMNAAQARAEVQNVQDARRRIGQASQQNLEELRRRDRRAFEGAGVANNLKGTQMESLTNSTELAGDRSVGRIAAHRTAAFETAVAPTGPTMATDRRTARRAARNMSEDERRTVARSVDATTADLAGLEAAATAPAATPAQVDAWLGATAQIAARIDSMEPKDVLHLSDNTIMNRDIIPHLNARHLKALHNADRLDETQRRALRTAIVDTPGHQMNATASAKRFFTTAEGRTWI